MIFFPRWLRLLTTIVETFQSTMNQCFATVVGDILGRTVRAEIFELLRRNGIQASEISSRFDNVGRSPDHCLRRRCSRSSLQDCNRALQGVFSESRFHLWRVSKRPDHPVEGESGYRPSKAK